MKKLRSGGIWVLFLFLVNACYYLKAVPEADSIQVGDTVGIKVRLASAKIPLFGRLVSRPAKDVYGVGFELDYDPAVLNFVEAQDSGGIANADIMTAFRNSASENGQLVVGISKSGQEPGDDSPFELVRIVFQAVGTGTADITIRDDNLVNSEGERPYLSKGAPRGCTIIVQ